MAKLPLPPERLPLLRARDIHRLPTGTTTWRIYRAGGRHPSTWSAFRRYGPLATGRFDPHPRPPHDDPAHGIIYAALDIIATVAEVFQETRIIDRTWGEPWLAGFELHREVPLLDLTGAWPTRAGASQALSTGRRDIARAWSRAIRAAYPSIEGLLYRSSMAGGSRNLALFEVVEDAMPSHPSLHIPLVHPGLDLPLRRLADDLGYGLR